MASSPSPRSSEAREKARQIAAKQSKRSSNSSRLWWQIGVVVVLVLIIGIIAAVYTHNKKGEIPDSGPVPTSANQYGGIVVTKDGIKKDTSDVDTRDVNDLKTSSASASPDDESEGKETTLPVGMPTADEAKKNGQPPRVTIFQDYNCIHCAEFEKANGEEIKRQVLDGDATLEIRNLNFLDQETSTEYSSRAAMAAYSVAEQVSPEKFLDWQAEMFSHQGQGGMSNKELAALADKYGADIKDDLDSNKYRPMVNVTVAESKENGLSGTPTSYVDSTKFTGQSFTDFLNGIKKAKSGS
ncbi:DsbA family protein [Rothia uropygialis]|uniref:DsbA family protein n=1 Tax=Kocuria sp. 36 TaxID=1415402 RepID=UPI00101D375F|nr:thioredoxin domain-containing protein [Kocuria sp. 36]